MWPPQKLLRRISKGLSKVPYRTAGIWNLPNSKPVICSLSNPGTRKNNRVLFKYQKWERRKLDFAWILSVAFLLINYWYSNIINCSNKYYWHICNFRNYHLILYSDSDFIFDTNYKIKGEDWWLPQILSFIPDNLWR